MPGGSRIRRDKERGAVLVVPRRADHHPGFDRGERRADVGVLVCLISDITGAFATPTAPDAVALVVIRSHAPSRLRGRPNQTLIQLKSAPVQTRYDRAGGLRSDSV